jgi:hypothetical protein
MPCRSSRGQKPTTACGNRFSHNEKTAGPRTWTPPLPGWWEDEIPVPHQATTYPEKCSIDQLNCFVSGAVTPWMTSEMTAVFVTEFRSD